MIEQQCAEYEEKRIKPLRGSNICVEQWKKIETLPMREFKPIKKQENIACRICIEAKKSKKVSGKKTSTTYIWLLKTDRCKVLQNRIH